MSWSWPQDTGQITLEVWSLTTHDDLALAYGQAVDGKSYAVLLTTEAEQAHARRCLAHGVARMYCDIDELIPAELVSAFLSVTPSTSEE